MQLFKEYIIIIIRMSFKNNYFDLILKYANKYKPSKHNTKYSNRYYLTHILDQCL
jgi:hypothetical protein